MLGPTLLATLGGVAVTASAVANTNAPPTPAAQRVSHSFLERETLTDDWFQDRPTLREHGINLTGAFTQFYQGLASGDGDHDWEYGGKLDGFLRLDGGRLGLWNGLGLNAHAELNYGQSAVFTGGTFLPANLASFFPSANETRADLSLYFSQQLGRFGLGHVRQNQHD